LSQILTELALALGDPALLKFGERRRSQHDPDRVVGSNTALRGLGWRPRHNLRQTLAMAESFFATLKTEFYRRVRTTNKAARIEVGNWIEDRYNRRRRHASIGQISPVAFELQYSHQIANSQKTA
jgi:transposase InsO family protein